jgi:DNA-directed RNA polymerase specialized sigma24 family protein
LGIDESRSQIYFGRCADEAHSPTAKAETEENGNFVRFANKCRGKAMKSVLELNSNPHIATPKNPCSAAGDFQRVFATEMTDMFRLALLLTADTAKAERCLMLAMRACFRSSGVSREQAHILARRAVIRNAIRSVLNAEDVLPAEIRDDLSSQICLGPEGHAMKTSPESLAIMGLSNFERVVFVICVLEGYDTQDCAVLLGRAQRDVQDALAQATSRIVSFAERKKNERSTAFQTSSYGAVSNVGREQDEACGTLLG